MLIRRLTTVFYTFTLKWVVVKESTILACRFSHSAPQKFRTYVFWKTHQELNQGERENYSNLASRQWRGDPGNWLQLALWLSSFSQSPFSFKVPFMAIKKRSAPGVERRSGTQPRAWHFTSCGGDAQWIDSAAGDKLSIAGICLPLALLGVVTCTQCGWTLGLGLSFCTLYHNSFGPPD